MCKKKDIIKIIEDIDLDIKVTENDFVKTFKELEIDSLDTFNIISEIENTYDIKISDEDFEKINSLNDVLNFVKNVKKL
jgi:acyl carrier protein